MHIVSFFSHQKEVVMDEMVKALETKNKVCEISNEPQSLS
jgi:hypothetical protein